MKKKVIYFWMVLIGMLSPMACDTDFLNTQPLDKISGDVTWADPSLSQAFIYNVYSYLYYGGFEEEMLASMTDEAMFTHAGRSIKEFNEGSESSSNLAKRSRTYEWPVMYLAIRQANVALENLPIAPFDNEPLKNQLMGEAYFLRAYYYHQLLRYYGGFAIIDKAYKLNEDYSIERSSFEACVNFIVSDLDQAATLLEGVAPVAGRASKLTAMALKSRILLYAASDLHHLPTAAAKSSTISSYGNTELLGYPSGDRVARWQAAKVASKAVLDAGTGYKLDLGAPVSPEEGRENYISLSMGGGSKAGDAAANVELILQRTHTPLYTQEDNWPLGGIHHGINNGPNGYHNWAGNTPIQQLVDDYEMMDGSKFSWSNPTHSADPYANRDPRFYATILYDGAKWKPRPADVIAKDPVSEIQTGYYDNGTGGTVKGLDTRESEVENWNGSRTHYYVRKFIDPDPGVVDNQTGSQIVPWPFIRYTEAVLNYAEACIELGEEAEAKTWLNKIRFRAGMPAITESGAALTDRYRNERRIELAYEEHRYHDARRWMIPDVTLGRPIKHMYILATLKPGKTPLVPYRYDKDTYNYTYTPQNNTEIEIRKWVDKMYYRPMSRDELSINSKLVQNPGYE